MPTSGDQPLCHGEQAGWGGWGVDLCKIEVKRCLSHPRSERVGFSHVLFFAGGGQAKPTARVIVVPWAVIAGHQHRLPSADRLLVSRGWHAAAALSQRGGCLEGERKDRCRQNGWFSAKKKRYLLLSPCSKRGRMDLLQSHVLVGGCSAAGGISEDMKLGGFGGRICETCGSTQQSKSSSRDPFYQLLKQIQGKPFHSCC